MLITSGTEIEYTYFDIRVLCSIETMFPKWAFSVDDYVGRFGKVSRFDPGRFGSGPFRPDPFRGLTYIQGKRLKIYVFRVVKVF